MKHLFISIFFILSSNCFPIFSQSNYFEISKNLEIFNDIFKELNMYYVDATEPGNLMEKAIDSMLKAANLLLL